MRERKLTKINEIAPFFKLRTMMEQKCVYRLKSSDYNDLICKKKKAAIRKRSGCNAIMKKETLL